MKNTFSILFYLKRRNSDLASKAPVYMRVTVNGRRSELSVHRKVNVSKWNHKAGKLLGTKQEVKEFNDYLDAIRNKVYNILNNWDGEYYNDSKAAIIYSKLQYYINDSL